MNCEMERETTQMHYCTFYSIVSHLVMYLLYHPSCVISSFCDFVIAFFLFFLRLLFLSRARLFRLPLFFWGRVNGER
jgi:hypothetical protein